MCNVGIGVTPHLTINTEGSVSLAEPCPKSPLHISEGTEVVRVFPIYNSLSNEKKREILGNVKKWIESEEARLDNKVPE